MRVSICQLSRVRTQALALLNVKPLTGYYCQSDVASLDHLRNPTLTWLKIGVGS